MSVWTISLIISYSMVILCNLCFSFSVQTLCNLLICLAIIMLPAGLFLLLGRTVLKSHFSKPKKTLKKSNFKQKVCQLTKVKKWKDKIPVGGRIAKFRMNKLERPTDLTYLNKYIFESTFAEWLHTTTAFWGLVAVIIIFFINKSLVLTIALPFALIFFFQNISSSIIQWYMRPRIINLRDKLLQKQNNN